MTDRSATYLPPLMALLIVLATLAPRGLPVLLVLYAAIVALSCGAWWQRIDWRHTGRAFALPATLYAGLLFSSLWSPSPRVAEMVRDSAIVALPLAILFALLPLWPAALRRNTVSWMVKGVLVAFMLLAVQVMFNFPLDQWVNGRPADFAYWNTNIPKRMAVVLLLFSWPAALALSRWRGWAGWVLPLTVLLLLPFLSSRSAVIAAIIGLLALIAGRSGAPVTRLLGFASLPLALPFSLLATVATVLAAPYLVELLPHSGDGRIALWAFALKQTVEALPFGIGLDGTRVFTPQIPVHTHNAFLQIALEGGLWASGLLTYLLYRLWQRTDRLPLPLQRYTYAYAVSAAIMLSLTYGLWQGWWLAAQGLAGFMMVLATRPAGNP